MIYPSKRYTRVVVSRRIVRQVLDRARRFSGLEVAGIFLGRIVDKEALVQMVQFSDKAYWGSNRFYITEERLLRLFSLEEGSNEGTAVGVFHVHPRTAAFPSFLDIKNMMLTKVPWIIVKPAGDVLRMSGYNFEDGVVRGIQIKRI